jgi:uncharacterized protein (TIGR00251 family)
MPNATLRVRLTPRADRNELSRYEEGLLHARVTAPPIDGAANAALVELLAAGLGVRKSAIIIVSGLSSREKRVEFRDLTDEELRLKVESAIGKKTA